MEEGDGLAGGEESVAVAGVGLQGFPLVEAEDNRGRVEKAAKGEDDIAGVGLEVFVGAGMGEGEVLEDGLGKVLAAEPGGGIAGVFSLEEAFEDDTEVAFGDCWHCFGVGGEEFVDGATACGVHAEEGVGEIAAEVAPEHLRAGVHTDGDEQALGDVLEPAADAAEEVGFAGAGFAG
jgi:hypothetical protein